jgi:hypothetical protein
VEERFTQAWEFRHITDLVAIANQP